MKNIKLNNLNLIRNLVIITLLVCFVIDGYCDGLDNFLCQNIIYSPIPADPRPRTIVQPNGKTLTYYLRGDERMHWTETEDGYTILANEQGYLEFACINEDSVLMCSGILACNEKHREEEELNFLAYTPQKVFFLSKQAIRRH